MLLAKRSVPSRLAPAPCFRRPQFLPMVVLRWPTFFSWKVTEKRAPALRFQAVCVCETQRLPVADGRRHNSALSPSLSSTPSIRETPSIPESQNRQVKKNRSTCSIAIASELVRKRRFRRTSRNACLRCRILCGRADQRPQNQFDGEHPTERRAVDVSRPAFTDGLDLQTARLKFLTLHRFGLPLPRECGRQSARVPLLARLNPVRHGC
jgi:hypothetical protein